MRGFRTWISGPQREVSRPGSQDLGFRPSMRGFRTWLSRPGFQDLESSPSYGRLIFFPSLFSASTVTFLFPVTFLYVQWSQTDARTDALSRALVRSLPGSSGISHALTAWFPNPTVRAESRFPNPTIWAGSAGGLKHGTVVSRTNRRTT
jgi:hypothetical protein